VERNTGLNDAKYFFCPLFLHFILSCSYSQSTGSGSTAKWFAIRDADEELRLADMKNTANPNSIKANSVVTKSLIA